MFTFKQILTLTTISAMVFSVGKSWSLFLIPVVIILFAALGYFIFQNQKLISQLSSQTSSPSPSTPSVSPQPSPSPTPSPSPQKTAAEVQENIEAAVNSRNLVALATYMTKPKVNFSLMSSECCEPMTPDEAVAQMSYIDEGVPMDFDQNNPTIKNLKAKNSQLAGSFIGISIGKEHLAAFSLNSENRISAIQLSVSWKLYNQ